MLECKRHEAEPAQQACLAKAAEAKLAPDRNLRRSTLEFGSADLSFGNHFSRVIGARFKNGGGEKEVTGRCVGFRPTGNARIGLAVRLPCVISFPGFRRRTSLIEFLNLLDESIQSSANFPIRLNDLGIDVNDDAFANFSQFIFVTRVKTVHLD